MSMSSPHRESTDSLMIFTLVELSVSLFDSFGEYICSKGSIVAWL